MNYLITVLEIGSYRGLVIFPIISAFFLFSSLVDYNGETSMCRDQLLQLFI